MIFTGMVQQLKTAIVRSVENITQFFGQFRPTWLMFLINVVVDSCCIMKQGKQPHNCYISAGVASNFLVRICTKVDALANSPFLVFAL